MFRFVLNHQSQIDGRRGYVNRAHIQEQRVYRKDLVHTVPTEVAGVPFTTEEEVQEEVQGEVQGELQGRCKGEREKEEINPIPFPSLLYYIIIYLVNFDLC